VPSAVTITRAPGAEADRSLVQSMGGAAHAAHHASMATAALIRRAARAARHPEARAEQRREVRGLRIG
jgi:hypothetical protein